MKLLLLAISALALCTHCKSKPAPEAPAAPMRPVTDAPAPSDGSGPAEITWTAPASWKSHPPTTRMRKAQYSLPGKTDKDAAELAVFHFPGTGGGVQDNLDRWYTQFKQPDGSETKKLAQVKRVTVSGLKITVTYVTGTYLKPKMPMMMAGPTEEIPGQAMLAAIVETGHGPWFFKAVGPKKTLDAHRSLFDLFVLSFRAKR